MHFQIVDFYLTRFLKLKHFVLSSRLSIPIKGRKLLHIYHAHRYSQIPFSFYVLGIYLIYDFTVIDIPEPRVCVTKAEIRFFLVTYDK